MDDSRVSQILDRARSWPEKAQEELAEIAGEIEAELAAGAYRPGAAELRGIDRGLRDAEQERFATDEEIEATFGKYRGR